MPTISLHTEKRDNTVFIYGDWWLGEIRLSFDELGTFRTEQGYSDYSGDGNKQCSSCHQQKSPTQINILELDDESLPICIECKTELQQTIDTFVKANSEDISLDII